jgi:alpha-beta hydrolase superfamily lysophospholipase
MNGNRRQGMEAAIAGSSSLALFFRMFFSMFFSVFFSLLSEASALRPVRDYAGTPGDYGVIYEEVIFQSPDSLRLVGWFYPAQDTAGIANDLVGRVFPVPESLRVAPRSYTAPDRAPGPVVVLCDGDGGNMADLIFYAYQFFTRGYHVFTFDWRGFGRSAAWPMDPDQLCCSEFLQDYEAAITYIKTRPEVDAQRIGLLGFSTGAYLSFAMLPTHPEIAAFAGRALLTSFDDILPILGRLDAHRHFRAPADYPTQRLPIHAAPSVHTPVFLAVGEHDPRTPPWMSQKIVALLPGSQELWIVPGAGHGGAEAPEFTRYPEFFERVAAFFDEHMRGS